MKLLYINFCIITTGLGFHNLNIVTNIRTTIPREVVVGFYDLNCSTDLVFGVLVLMVKIKFFMKNR